MLFGFAAPVAVPGVNWLAGGLDGAGNVVRAAGGSSTVLEATDCQNVCCFCISGVFV